jgi:hypothetical protein
METTQPRLRSSKLILVLVLIFWLAATLSLYYLAQNALLQPTWQLLTAGRFAWLPWSWSLTAVLRTLLDLLAAGWILFIALGCGSYFLRRLSPAGLSALEHVLFGLALGCGALGLLTLVLGLVGLLQPITFYATAVILTLLTARSSLNLLGQLQWPRPGPLVSVYLLLSFGLALTLALQPPTAWDSLFYHLTGPKLYLAAGAIRPGIDVPHLNFPSLFQMLFLVALAIRGDVAAQLLHFGFALMLAGIVYATARQHLSVRNRWLAVLFLVSMPMISGLAAWAYNDLALAFYSTAAIYAFLKGQGAGDRGQGTGRCHEAANAQRWLILSGLCLGAALSLKYTAFVLPAAVSLLLIWQYRRRPLAALRPLAYLVVPALLVALPWYAKNLLFTGNPVYPFLFGGPFWDGYRSQVYAEAGTGIGWNAWALLRLPVDLTLGIRDVSRDGATGPLFLLFLPLLIGYSLYGRRLRPPPAFYMLLQVALFYYLFWVIGVMNSVSLFQTRLLLPALVLLCPALAWLLEDLWRFNRPGFSLQRLLTLILSLVLAAGMLIQLIYWLPHQPWAYLSGRESRSQNLERRLGEHYVAMSKINEQLPDDAVILFIFEPRSYYCEADCRPDSILDRYGHLHDRHGDAAAIAGAWQREGVTHVLLWRHGLDFLLSSATPGATLRLPDPSILDQLQKDYLKLVSHRGGYELFAVLDLQQSDR